MSNNDLDLCLLSKENFHSRSSICMYSLFTECTKGPFDIALETLRSHIFLFVESEYWKRGGGAVCQIPKTIWEI